MPIKFRCSHCLAQLSVKEDNAGKEGPCPKCGKPIRIPLRSGGSSSPDLELADGASESPQPPELPEPPPVEAASPPLGIGVAVGLAVAGALTWALVLHFADYELGMLAWGIGAAIGFGAVAVGSRGIGMGVLCAALTLLSIFSGKYLGFTLAYDSVREEVEAENFSRELYEEYKIDAADFAALPEEAEMEEIAQFMVDHAYSPHDSPLSISEAEYDDFVEYSIPMLQAMHREQPSFEQWHADQIAEFEANMAEEYAPMDMLTENLNHYDVLFAILGVVTAFGALMRPMKSARNQG